MSKLSNIDLAYEYLKHKNDSAQFKEIWTYIETKSTQDHADKTALMASLYSGLVCDNRFSLTPEGSWALKNNLKFENVKKQYDNPNQKQMRKYDLVDDEDTLRTQYDEELEEEFDTEEDRDENEADFGDGDIEVED